MERDKITKKILERMAEVLVARKTELVKLVKNDINPEDPRDVVDNITKMLVQSGLITPLYACETTFAITQKGMKEDRNGQLIMDTSLTSALSSYTIWVTHRPKWLQIR